MPYRSPIGDPMASPPDPAIVRESIDIAAPPAEVFRALADPHELSAWLGGEAISAPASDATDTPDSPGAWPPAPRDPSGAPAAPLDLPLTRWTSRVVAPDGTIGTVEGEYGYSAPPHFLETSWRASWNDFALERVRFALVPIEVDGTAGTRVTVTHTRAAARMLAPSAAFSPALASQADLWPSLLARLAIHLATVGALARWRGHDVGSADAFEALHRAVMARHGAR